MNKRQRNFQKISEFKQRFEKLSTETIRYRLGIGSLIKEAEIAYKEILKERGVLIYIAEGTETKADEETGRKWTQRMMVVSSSTNAAQHSGTGRLGFCAFFGVVSKLWQFSVFKLYSPQPPVTGAVGR